MRASDGWLDCLDVERLLFFVEVHNADIDGADHVVALLLGTTVFLLF